MRRAYSITSGVLFLVIQPCVYVFPVGEVTPRNLRLPIDLYIVSSPGKAPKGVKGLGNPEISLFKPQFTCLTMAESKTKVTYKTRNEGRISKKRIEVDETAPAYIMSQGGIERRCRQNANDIFGRINWPQHNSVFWPRVTREARLNTGHLDEYFFGYHSKNRHMEKFTEGLPLSVKACLQADFSEFIKWLGSHYALAVHSIHDFVENRLEFPLYSTDDVELAMYIFKNEVKEQLWRWYIAPCKEEESYSHDRTKLLANEETKGYDEIDAWQTEAGELDEPFRSPLMREKLSGVIDTSILQINSQILRIERSRALADRVMYRASLARIIRSLDFLISQLNQTIDRMGRVIRKFRTRKEVVLTLKSFITFETSFKNRLLESKSDEYVRDCTKTIAWGAAHLINHMKTDHDTDPEERCLSRVLVESPNVRANTEEYGHHLKVYDMGGDFETQAGDPEGGDEPIVDQSKEENENLVFQDQRQVEEAETHLGGDVAAEDDDTGASTDVAWRFSDQVCGRYWLVDNLLWQVGDSVGPLTSYVVPAQLMRSDGQAGNCGMPADTHSAYFGFARPSMTVKLQVNSTKFNQGMIVMAFLPFATMDNNNVTVDNIFALPHVIIDASTSNSGELKIPYNHFYSQFALRGTANPENQYLGQLKIMIMNTLQAADSASKSVRLSLYAKLENAKFSVLLPFNDKQRLSNLPTIIKPRGEVTMRKMKVPMVRGDNAKLFNEVPRIANVWEAQAGVLGMIPELLNVVGGDDGILKSAMRFGSAFAGNCDNPTMAAPALPVGVRVMDCTAAGNGLDVSNRLSLDRKSYTKTTSKMMASKRSDMDLLEYMKIPTRLCTISWSADAAPNTQLVTIPISPSMVSRVDWNGAMVDVVPTALGFGSRCFMYWRGSLFYRIQFVTSQVHSGRAIVTFHYDANRTNSTGLNLCEKQMRPSVICDVQEKKVFELEVPFNCTQPYLKCSKLTSINEKDPGVLNVSPGDQVLGYLTISVLNELAVPNNVFRSVDINVYVAAGKDFEMFNPEPVSFVHGFHSVKFPGVSALHRPRDGKTEEEEKWEIEAGEEKTDKSAPESKITNVANREKKAAVVPQVKQSARSLQMPERHTDLKMLLKRYYPVTTRKVEFNKATDKMVAWIVPVRPRMFRNPTMTLDGTPSNVQEVTNHIAYTSQGFTYWRGSMRFKVSIPAVSPSLQAWVVYKPNEYKDFTTSTVVDRIHLMRDLSSGTVLYSGNVCGSLEFEIPYMSKYVKLQTGYNLCDATECNGIFVVYFDAPTNRDVSCWATLFQSIGDDFEFNTIRGPPTLTFMGCSDVVTKKENNPEKEYWQLYNTGYIDRTKTICSQPEPQCAQTEEIDTLFSQAQSLNNMGVWCTNGEMMKGYMYDLRCKDAMPGPETMMCEEWTTRYARLGITDPNSPCGQYIKSLGLIDTETNTCHWFGGKRKYNIAPPVTCEHIEAWVTEMQPNLQVYMTMLELDVMKPTLFTTNCNNDGNRKIDNWLLDDAKAMRGFVCSMMTLSNCPNSIWAPYLRAYGTTAAVVEWYGPAMATYAHNLNDAIFRKQVTHVAGTPYSIEGVFKNKGKTQIDYIASTRMNKIISGLRARYPDWTPSQQAIKERFPLIEMPVIEFQTQGLSDMNEAAKNVNAMVPHLLETCETLQASAIQLNDKFTAMEEKCDGINEKVQPVFSAVIGVNEKLTSISSRAMKLIDSYLPNDDKVNMLKLGAIAFNVSGLLSSWKWSQKLGHAVSLAALFGLDGQVIYDAFTTFVSYLSGVTTTPPQATKGVETQAGLIDSMMSFVTEKSEFFKIVLGTIATGIFSIFTTRLPEKKSVLPFVEKMCEKAKILHMASQGAKGVKWFWEFITNAISESVDWVLGKEHPSFNAIRWLAGGSSEINEWFKSIDEYEGDDAILRMAWDPEIYKNLCGLIDRGYVILERLCEAKKPSKLDILVRDGLRRLRATKLLVDKEAANVPVRVDPFCVSLVGAPGVGKSAMLNELLHDVLNELEYPNENRIYSRSDTDDYWSNYRAQSAVIIDDFYSNTESTIVQEFIQLKSNVNHALNMADLQEKGRPFLSHFIFMTSNVAYPKPTKIISAEALQRRRDVLVEVRSVGGEKTFTVLHSKIEGQVIVGGLNYADLVKYITTRATPYLENQRNFVRRQLMRGKLLLPEGVAQSLKNAPNSREIDWVREAMQVQAGEDEIAPGTVVQLSAGELRNMMEEVAYRYGVLDNQARVTARAVGKPIVAKEDACAYYEELLNTFTKSKSRQMWMETFGHKTTTCDEDFYVSEDFWDYVTMKEGKIEINRDAMPELMLFELSLMENGVNWEEKLVEAWKSRSSIARARKTVGKYADIVESEVRTLRQRFEEWTKEHPRITIALKVIGGVVSTIGIFKLSEYLFPDMTKAIRAKVCEWLGMSSKSEEKEGKWKPWVRAQIMGNEMYEHYEDGTYDEYVSRPETNILKRLRRKWKQLYGKNSPEVQALDEEVQGGGTYDALSRVPTNSKPQSRLTSLRTQSGDQNAREIQTHRIAPNIVFVEGPNRFSNSKQYVRGLFICEDYLMLPYHFVHKLSNGDELKIHSRDETFMSIYDVNSAKRVEGCDCAIVKLGGRCKKFRSIWKLFPKKDEMQVVQSLTAVLFKAGKPDENGIVTHSEMIVNATAMVMERVSDAQSQEVFQDQFGWMYQDAYTEKGDCGAVLIALCPRMPRKILGIHVAGKPGDGGFTLALTQEMIMGAIDPEYIKIMEDRSNVAFMVESLTDENEIPKIKFDGAFMPLGVVKKEHAVILPRKTQIKPSVIHDEVWPHSKEPSVLTRSDPRNTGGVPPLERAIVKYGTPRIDFNSDLLSSVAIHLHNIIDTKHVEIMERRLLSDVEVVIGNDAIEYLDRMNMTTSAGFPWRKLNPTSRGKAWMFDQVSGEVLCSQLMEKYREREEMARAGARVVSVWTDCLKDELRPIEKVVAGKTRLFTIPPVDFTMLFRKYFLAFIVNFYANNTRTFSAVGVDPYSVGWTNIYMRLIRYKENAIAGDFAEFDGGMLPQVLWAWVQVVNKWYSDGDENATVRCVLMHEIINTVQLCLNVLYMSTQGNPSGNPATTVLNTMVNKMYFMAVYLELALKFAPHHASLMAYDQFVCDMFYGDDSVLTVSKEIVHWFNQHTIAEQFAKHGIKYTTEAKDEMDLGISRKLDDVSFLKNGFSLHPYVPLYRATMSYDTIFELTNWIRTSDCDVAMTRDNCWNALQFGYYHGKELYESLREAINAALRRKGICGFAETYELMDMSFLAKCGY